MSTTLLIDRIPAATRRAFSHGGDGPTLTSVKTRPDHRGQSSGSSTRTLTYSSTVPSPVGSGSMPGQGARSRSKTADTSRATPYTQRQSGRFEVISRSIT